LPNWQGRRLSLTKYTAGLGLSLLEDGFYKEHSSRKTTPSLIIKKAEHVYASAFGFYIKPAGRVPAGRFNF
jgi:hypothetical protein